VEKVIDLGDLRAKFEAFGWLVIRMNGNDIAISAKKCSWPKVASGKGNPSWY